jgi:hypothetical protein
MVLYEMHSALWRAVKVYDFLRDWCWDSPRKLSPTAKPVTVNGGTVPCGSTLTRETQRRSWPRGHPPHHRPTKDLATGQRKLGRLSAVKLLAATHPTTTLSIPATTASCSPAGQQRLTQGFEGLELICIDCIGSHRYLHNCRSPEWHNCLLCLGQWLLMESTLSSGSISWRQPVG